MTRKSGGADVNRGPAPEPGSDRAGDVAGNAAGKSEDPSPDERERGDGSDPEDCTARERAS